MLSFLNCFLELSSLALHLIHYLILLVSLDFKSLYAVLLLGQNSIELQRLLFDLELSLGLEFLFFVLKLEQHTVLVLMLNVLDL